MPKRRLHDPMLRVSFLHRRRAQVTRSNAGGGDADRVRTFIKQLRRKLGDDAARPTWILNERGVGYRVPKPEG